MRLTKIELTFFSSREMAKRNKLFKKMVESLVEDFDMAPEEASKLSKKALVENRGKSSGRGPGGQSGKTKPVTVVTDACEGKVFCYGHIATGFEPATPQF